MDQPEALRQFQRMVHEALEELNHEWIYSDDDGREAQRELSLDDWWNHFHLVVVPDLLLGSRQSPEVRRRA